ncbi:SPX domain-containing protein [Mycena vulgaris]|nr:SPX domain-containing protein [Mycena vulgaris]
MQTPEWQKAYIDYRLLKKRITAIRRANGQNVAESPTSTQINPNPGEAEASHGARIQPMDTASSSRASISPSLSKDPPNETTNASLSNLIPSSSGAQLSQQRVPLDRSQTLPAPSSVKSQKSNRGRAPSFSRMFSSNNSTSRRFTVGGPKPHPYSELPLRDLLPLLSPPELAFFTTLDAELDKIERFYVAREKEMQLRTKLLEQQLDELSEHRKLFNAAYPSGAWTSAINAAAMLKFKSKLLNAEETVESTAGPAKNKALGKLPGTVTSSRSNLTQERGTAETDHGTVHLDPEEYHDAKHKLKKAVLEHYRVLEVLHNYRILNLTGIRKALKKFQKVTKIAAQNAYMTEKVDKASFASDVNLRAMMDEMEEMYASRFAHGDKKKATTRLRSGLQHKSHHASTFWSGIFVGLAVPAFASGLYHSEKSC